MPERKEQVLALNVKLSPVEDSDQPVSANYSTIGVVQGIAYLDFGFIEPSELAQVVRKAQAGKEVPQKLDGKLVVRVAMGLDVLQRLHQQLQQVMNGLRTATSGKSGSA